jgi:hypothetical protein
LAVTPKEELAAFGSLDKEHNPFQINDCQSAVLLYCLLDNDAGVVLPLLEALIKEGTGRFDERFAGDLLPDILRGVISAQAKRSLPAEEKDQLSLLNKIATNVAKWKGKPYTGSGAREEAVRVRLEPYCDLGFFRKPSREKFEYELTDSVRTLINCFHSFPDIDVFLQNGFFGTIAKYRGLNVQAASEDEAVKALAEAGEALKSYLGYTPLIDVGLLAGAKLLAERSRILEHGRTLELLRALQKRDPNFVRFTVDRTGALAHVKFLKPERGV